MAITLAQAEQAQASFMKMYWCPPHGDCITSVGFGIVGHEDPSLPQAEHADHCIAVGLYPPLPAGVSFPSHHDGVRVVAYETGGAPSPYDF